MVGRREGGRKGGRLSKVIQKISRHFRLPTKDSFIKSYYSKWCPFDIELAWREAKVCLFNVDLNVGELSKKLYI